MFWMNIFYHSVWIPMYSGHHFLTVLKIFSTIILSTIIVQFIYYRGWSLKHCWVGLGPHWQLVSLTDWFSQWSTSRCDAKNTCSILKVLGNSRTPGGEWGTNGCIQQCFGEQSVWGLSTGQDRLGRKFNCYTVS